MFLTCKIRLNKLDKIHYDLLNEMTYLSKNIYNSALYEIKNYYNSTNSYLDYQKTWNIIKLTENYEKLPSQVGQQTLKIIDRNAKSFFSLLNESFVKKIAESGAVIVPIKIRLKNLSSVNFL